MKKIRKIEFIKLILVLIIISLCNTNINAQENREIEITAQEILARVDNVLKYPEGLLEGYLMHIYPNGKKVSLKVKANIAEEDFLFTFSSTLRGDQLRVLYNLGGEDIWVYNLLSIKLFHKIDVGKYEPLLETNYNFIDLSNADLQSNYIGKLKGETVVKGRRVFYLTLDPIYKDGEYGKLTLYVTKENYLPLRIDYHDRDKVLLKTMSIAKLATFKKRAFPVRYDMLDIKRGTLTILQFNDYDEKIKHSKKIFRHENLGEK